jgi:hypothetical protein
MTHHLSCPTADHGVSRHDAQEEVNGSGTAGFLVARDAEAPGTAIVPGITRRG